MFLKKLEINGFKSFARPITIKFDSPLTAIVGPNGSGKSNIVDAIRWVLGEQSAKTLRGNKMADIIFSGSKDYKPRQNASVFLYLDNSDHNLSMDTDEIVVGRKVNNDGESEYFLNNGSCRLKDIKTLLLDTGLGRDYYSIVGQGKISSILNSKPEKLRELFEEAAGISKYKARKDDAEKKLENTRQNLLRISDLISEFKKQLKPLKNAADKVEKYENLTHKLSVLEISYFMEKWEKNQAELTAIQIDKEFLFEKISSINKNLQKLKNNFNKHEKKLLVKKEELSVKKDNLYKLRAKSDELNNKLNLYQERKNNIVQDIDEINNWKNNISQKKEKINENISRLSKKITQAKTQINNLENKLDNHTGKLKIVNEKINNFFLLADIKELQNKQKELKYNQENRKKDKKKVIKELNIVNKQKEKLKEINLSISEKIEDKTSLLKQKNIDFEELKNKLTQCKSRLELVQELEENYEGYYYGVKNVLKNSDKFNGIKGVVAQLISVEDKYIKAVETALTGKMQNIVVEHDQIASEIINYLKSNKLGYATFLPLNLIKTKRTNIADKDIINSSGYICTALEAVNYESSLEKIINFLLSNTIITENINAAAEISRKSNSNYKIVTLSGDIIRPGGAMTGGSKNNNSYNLISRSHEIENLKLETNKLKNKLNNLRKITAVIEQELKDYKNNRDKNREEIHSLALAESNINADLNGINNEIININNKLSNNSQKLQERFDKLSNMDDDNNSKNENKIAKLEESKNIINNEITDIKINIAMEKQKVKNYTEEKERLKNNLKDYNLEYEQKNNDLDYKNNELINLTSKLRHINIEIVENNNTIEKKENILSQLEKQVKQLDDINSDLTRKRESEKAEYEEIKDKVHKVELRLSRLENLNERYQEKLEEKYSINPDKDDFNDRIKINDFKNISKKINELKSAIDAMGTINTGAKKEYNKIQEKVKYLHEQKQDLEKAQNSINNFIKEIEKTMNNLFLKTFNEVKEQFEIIFTKLFSGGKACLYLTNEDDLLNSGVEISAQPPGKKLKKLSLMSGGERALTAITIVFAFLNVNPSPFYILDEIDAPLDDANVIRFSNFIHEYAKSTQFIIITHRKYIMTQADIIYGVTMEDMGVSKLVSLNIKNTEGKIQNYVS